jgi:small acid-soluble spore protein B (major beta-type SASP)
MARNNNNNQLVMPGAKQAIEQVKYEIVSEFGVNLSEETTSRANGSVGGEITKRLVAMAQQSMGRF